MNKIHYKTKLSKYWYLNPWNACMVLRTETWDITYKYIQLIREHEEQSEASKALSGAYNLCLKERQELEIENKELKICLGVHGLDDEKDFVKAFADLQNRHCISIDENIRLMAKRNCLEVELNQLKSKLNLTESELERQKYINTKLIK